jgi:hypothetical protein
MKFWLIVFFLDSHGEFVRKREIAYKDEASCYIAMDNIRAPDRKTTIQMVCVSDDHHAGRKQDPGVPYD